MAAGNPPSVRRLTGKPNIFVYYQASGGSANAWYAGDLVKLDGNGALVIATSGNNLGIAQKTADGTTTTAIPVDVIMSDGSQFAMRLTSGTCAVSDKGEIADITYTAGAHVLASLAGTTDTVVLDNLDAVGVGNTEIVTFKAGALQGVTGF